MAWQISSVKTYMGIITPKQRYHEEEFNCAETRNGKTETVKQ